MFMILLHHNVLMTTVKYKLNKYVCTVSQLYINTYCHM